MHPHSTRLWQESVPTARSVDVPGSSNEESRSRWSRRWKRKCAHFAVLMNGFMVARRTHKTINAPMTPQHSMIEITDRSFAEKVTQSKVPVLLAFCAGDCVASRRLETLLTNATCGPSSATIAKAIPTEAPGLRARFGIVSVPAVLFFNDGIVCYQFIGELFRHELDELLLRADSPALGESMTNCLAANLFVTEPTSR